MKRMISAVLAVILVCALLAGCASTVIESTEPAKAEKTNVIVFAAASMTETLEEIAEMYKDVSPDAELTFNLDSSGTLKTQIEEGADCDLFISAAQKQMDQLDATADAEKNPDGLDFIDSDTRIDLLENKVVLCVPENDPKNVDGFDTLVNYFYNTDDILMAMGNEDVPVGQYTQKILAYYNLNEAELAAAGKITYGSNVKEVTSQISEGSVDCGVVYSTDAFSAGLTVVDKATEAMCGKVIYPAAVLKNSKNSEAAKAFLDYLRTDEASKVFEKVGFTALK